MAKFKSVIATKDGKEQRIYLPLTKEGYLEPIVDEAVAMGALIKEDGKPFTQPELEEYRAKLKVELRAAEIAALKKRKPY